MLLYYILLLTFTFANPPYLGGQVFGISEEKYLGALVLLFAFFHLAFRKSPIRFWRSWQTRAFLLFFVLAGVSWFARGLGPFSNSRMLIYSSQLVFLIATLILVDSPKRLRWSLLAVLASMAWASLYALREWQEAISVYGLSYRPGWGPEGDSNYYTASAVICLAIAFYLFTRSENRFDRWFSAACAVPIVGAVLVGTSRGGLLALLAVGTVILFQSRRHRGTLLFIGAVLAALFLISPVSPVVRLLHPDFGDKTATNDRLELWSAGLRMIEAHPLAGIGLGNFKAEVPRYLLPGQHIDYIAHNTYIEMASEMGLPGLVLFLFILFATFRSLARTRHRAWEADSAIIYCAASGLFAGLAGFSVAMMFLSASFLKLLWFAVFFAAAIEGLPTALPQPAAAAESSGEEFAYAASVDYSELAWQPVGEGSSVCREWKSDGSGGVDG